MRLRSCVLLRASSWAWLSCQPGGALRGTLVVKKWRVVTLTWEVVGFDVKSQTHCIEGTKETIQGCCWRCVPFSIVHVCTGISRFHILKIHSKREFMRVFKWDLIAKVLQRLSFSKDVLKYKIFCCFGCIFFLISCAKVLWEVGCYIQQNDCC